MQRRSCRSLPISASNVARVVVLVAASMGSLALSACGRGQGGHPGAEREGVGTATITSADLKSSVESAAMRIAEAHCAQAETCTQHVSSHYAQENTQVCQSNIFTETKDRLNAKTCPLGVNEAKLPDCLAAMQGAGCFDPIDMYTRYAECTAKALCFKPND